MNKVFADARRNGHASVSLHVFEENRDAVRLYEANGFTVVDRMPGLRREPMLYAGDLLLMQADVPGTRR